MRSVSLYPPLSLALLAMLLCNAWVPSLHLHFFAPFLALAYYAAPFSQALWISVGCGILFDLISSEFRFGIMTLTLALTTLLLYSQKRHFFEDKSLALSLFTSAISAFATFLQWILVHLFDRGVPFSAFTFLTDGIIMPAVDGLYAFLWFTCPLKLYKYIKKAGWRGLLRPQYGEEEE